MGNCLATLITNNMVNTIKIVLSFSIIIFLIVTSCKKNEAVITNDLPICIEEILMDSTRLTSIKTVQAIMVKNEIHYWLNTDARHSDLTESIVNEQCEKVCLMCGICVPQKCSDKYDMEDWQIVWQP